jgi:hypothetical protein
MASFLDRIPAMTVHEYRIARVQRTLRWLEEDVPQLAMRFRDLSPERQKSAKRFAASMIHSTRAELQRLIAELPVEDASDCPCEPAD